MTCTPPFLAAYFAACGCLAALRTSRPARVRKQQPSAQRAKAATKQARRMAGGAPFLLVLLRGAQPEQAAAEAARSARARQAVSHLAGG